VQPFFIATAVLYSSKACPGVDPALGWILLPDARQSSVQWYVRSVQVLEACWKRQAPEGAQVLGCESALVYMQQRLESRLLGTSSTLSGRQ
jgi:hypothetical protein